MATVEEIRTGLIEKIAHLENKRLLEMLDEIVSSSAEDSDIPPLTPEQIEMLEMAEEDIRQGRLISQEEMFRRNLEWLNSK